MENFILFFSIFLLLSVLLASARVNIVDDMIHPVRDS